MTIMKQQFGALREGDRFYFENDLSLSQEEKEEINTTTMRDLVISSTTSSFLQP